MKLIKFKALTLLLALVSSISVNNLTAQPNYYYPPPPPAGYMQQMPPQAYNPGYPPPYYNNRGGYNNMPFNGFNNRRYSNGHSSNRPFSNGSFSNGPFSNGPWNRFNNGWGNGNGNNYGPDTDWFTDTPHRWMRNGPKEGAGQVFDDFLDGPSRMGDMPGGWSAPTISVPNPIDVIDELEEGSQDMFNND